MYLLTPFPGISFFRWVKNIYIYIYIMNAKVLQFVIQIDNAISYKFCSLKYLNVRHEKLFKTGLKKTILNALNSRTTLAR